MNVQQAKQIPLTGILSQIGVDTPQRRTDGLWYNSPFRQERTPSFKVLPAKNIWYDHGLGHGGTVIDFVMQYCNCATVSDALRECEQFSGVRGIAVDTLPLFSDAPSPALVRQADRDRVPSGPAITIEQVKPLQSPKLIQYIEKRGIPLTLARHFVQEAYYTVKGKDRPYYALAFANASGGYELRNPYFQAVAGSKDISLIQPDNPELFEVLIFEGFMDFLSALVSWGQRAPDRPVLVLNSVAMREKAVSVIREHGFTDLRLYLDRDESGRKLTAEFQALGGLTVVDGSGVYEGYKDFNARLMNERGRLRA